MSAYDEFREIQKTAGEQLDQLISAQPLAYKDIKKPLIKMKRG